TVFGDCLNKMFDVKENGLSNLYDLTEAHTAIMEQYFYHPDHLGSTSWITDGSGNAIQYMHYLPYGEAWIDQQSTSWNAPFTFTGKIKDAETGYNYFGARYYDSQLSVWLSVDPMSDQYPSLSPYTYCANNPIMMVDPDGRMIIIKFAGNEYIYKDRQLTINGSAYTPEANTFASDMLNCLNELYDNSALGKIIIDDLVNSNNKYSIQQTSGESNFTPNQGGNSTALSGANSEGNNLLKNTLINAGVDITQGAGGEININTRSSFIPFLPTTDGPRANLTMVLAHELCHAWDARWGLINCLKECECSGKDVSKNEYQACFNENRIRAQFLSGALPIRTHYCATPDGREGSCPVPNGTESSRPSWYHPNN
ncbi:MAG: yd repeat protein, partial [Bacteroidetes bacterium]|nr:yd repeat protein [Bacteroidota bacterium]